MSTDYNVSCPTCKLTTHLGQRMGGGYSFGYGSNDTDTPKRIMEWIEDHAYHREHPLIITECEDERIDGFKYLDSDDLRKVTKP